MGIPYPVFGVLALLLLAERVRPWRERFARRPGLYADLAFAFLNLQAVPVVAVWSGQALRWAGLSPAQAVWPLADWPLGVQLALYLLMFDWVRWIGHRLMHEVGWLWRLHRVHHRLEALNWAAAFHMHPLEVLVYHAAYGALGALAGFSPAAIQLAVTLDLSWEMLVHANVALPLDRLEWLMNTPAMHRWHHAHPGAAHPERTVNYGSLFSIWDRAFGTAHRSPAGPERLGFPGVERFPAGLSDELLSPWTVGDEAACERRE